MCPNNIYIENYIFPAFEHKIYWDSQYVYFKLSLPFLLFNFLLIEPKSPGDLMYILVNSVIYIYAYFKIINSVVSSNQ